MNEHDTAPPDNTEGLRKDEMFTQRLNRNGELFDDFEFSSEVVNSSQDGIYRKIRRRERNYGCGHDSQRARGGSCQEDGCFNDACIDCYTRCSSCQVGLCLVHVRFLVNEAGQKVPVCSHCRDTIKRRQFWGKFWAFILSPFISFDDHSK